MAVKRSGLGRNLSVLLGTSGNSVLEATPFTPTLQLQLDCLQPGKYQPRGEMETESLEELAASIKKQGLLQPILVRELSNGCYEIIAGERRWRASKLAGLTELPVIVKQVDDETAMAMALVENLQREDLNAMDQARAMHRLTTEFALTHQQVADILSKSRTAVSNFLRLLALSAPVKKYLEQGLLDMGHARALLALDESAQQQVAQLVLAKQLSVRETEKLVDRVKNGTPVAKSSKDIPSLDKQAVEALASKLQTRIQIKPAKAAGKGSLVIHYGKQLSLQKLLAELMLS
jgi:ParB family chromosome partitioning protein